MMSILEPELYLSEVEWMRHRLAFARIRTESNHLAVREQIEGSNSYT